MKTSNYKRFEELEEKYFGEKGTPERDGYEFDLKMELIGEKIKEL
jgi:HTH-type transcriptional regulator / antitoxin HipB